MLSERRHEPVKDSTFPRSQSLKSHKTLPRRKNFTDRVAASGNTSKGLAQLKRTVETTDGISDQIHSWIPKPPKFPNKPNVQPPLTPPSVAKEEDNSITTHINANGVPAQAQTTLKRSGLSTPVNQRSPPTPDNTPPRRSKPSRTLTPPHTSLHPSSRTGSFETANERFSSEDESGNPTPADRTARQQQDPIFASPARLQDFGLGLEVQSDEEIKRSAPPSRHGSSNVDNGLSDTMKQHIHYRNGQETYRHKSGAPSASEISIRKRTGSIRKSLPRPHQSQQSPRRVPSLTEQVDQTRNSPSSGSTEKIAEHVDWHKQSDDDIDLDAKLRQMDTRRLSQMSYASTVVEVTIVETPPQRRQTLRHTSKTDTLRTASSPVTGSNRSSLISTEPQHRLVHRNAKLGDRVNRQSISSEASRSMSSAMTKEQLEARPAVDIPQRRSSLKSSSRKTRHARNLSTNSSHRNVSRPSTAPDGEPGYFDQASIKPRSLSESAPSTNPKRQFTKRTRPFSPAVPARSSSLSAPTSRNVSRTTSLTSQSLHAHDVHHAAMSHTPLSASNDPAITAYRSGTPEGPSDVGEVEGSSSRHRSTLVTPFSIASMQSSTPGTMEINEATAISIFPHNNNSILVVQQTGTGANGKPERTSMIVPQANIALNDIASPTVLQQPRELLDLPPLLDLDKPRESTNSPLRNPRSPPQPPAFNFIAPTPVPNGPSETVQPPKRNTSIVSMGPFSSIKRAISSPARRYSESFVSPKSLTRSLTARRNRKVPAMTSQSSTESKLHPFWRPRGFWDDLSDSDDDSESDFGNVSPDYAVNNTLGTPQTKIVQGPPRSVMGRRFGSLKSFNRRASAASDRPRRVSTSQLTGTNGNNNLHDYEFVKRGDLLESGRSSNGIFGGANVPRLGYQVQFVGFGVVRDRLEKMKERSREKERDRLRKSIGGVVRPEEMGMGIGAHDYV